MFSAFFKAVGKMVGVATCTVGTAWDEPVCPEELL